MTDIQARELSTGVNQHGVRDHNERLILSMLQRHGALAGSDLSRKAGLSPQTVSVILRGLESDGLLRRGEPQRGKIGKPSIPMGINPEGAFSLGLKIGRRSADVIIVDFEGTVRQVVHTAYHYPTPQAILAFLGEGLRQAEEFLGPKNFARIAGIGVATPFEIWRWHDTIGAPADAMDKWRDFSLQDEIAKLTDLPVYIQNDATAACRAEHAYGSGRQYRDYAYFYLGAFIGGGIVLNNSIFDGSTNNAGAFGSLPVMSEKGGKPMQLIDVASLYLLEQSLVDNGIDPLRLWQARDNWADYDDQVDNWIETTAPYLAQAALTVCAVVDFEAVMIDGAMPDEVRSKLVAKVKEAIVDLDDRGIASPKIVEGNMGLDARSRGAASTPINARYFLNSHGQMGG